MKEYRVVTDFFAREAFWHAPQKSFTPANAYREDGGELVAKRIRLARPGTLEQFQADEYVRIPGNHVVAVRGELNDDEILVSEVVDVDPAPTAAEAAFLEEQFPDSFDDPEFGTFYHNKDQGNFHGEIPYKDIGLIAILESEASAAALAWMHEDFDKFMQEAKEYAARELLDLANDWGSDGWDEEEEGKPFAPLAEDDFVNGLSPISFYIHAPEDDDGDEDDDGEGGYDDEGGDGEEAEGVCFSIDFMAGDMFWGHNVNVEGYVSERGYSFADAEIWG